jgi:hypothetical protein
VQLVDATYDGGWELPVIGSVSAPAAVLIRPDGHVAWTGDGTQQGLEDALASWFGPARQPRDVDGEGRHKADGRGEAHTKARTPMHM